MRKWHQLSRSEQAVIRERQDMDAHMRAEMPGHRMYHDDRIIHPPAEASYGRAATRRRAQAAARQAKREQQA